MPRLKHRPIPPLTAKTIARLLKKTIIKGPNEDWPWTAGKFIYKNCEYGKINIDDQPYLAHRVSFVHYNGYDPLELVIRHTCDFGLCQNPAHLVAGTQDENTDDQVKRERSAWLPAEFSFNSVLTEIEVRDIVRRCLNGQTRSSVAELYQSKVTIAAIHSIIGGRSWKHILAEELASRKMRLSKVVMDRLAPKRSKIGGVAFSIDISEAWKKQGR